MIVLAIDTCLGACSVAVAREGEVLAALSEPMQRGHQERLAAMAREAMEAAGQPFGAVARIGVTVGPGSFTGLRVGLAFAKGLALATGRPCVGIGALEALAEGEGLRAAVIDAGRGHVFLQAFRDGGALEEPSNLPLEAAAARLARLGGAEAVVTGPGASLFAGPWTFEERLFPSPQAVARLAASAPIAGPPRPLYLRAPDARPPSLRPKVA